MCVRGAPGAGRSPGSRLEASHLVEHMMDEIRTPGGDIGFVVPRTRARTNS